MLRMLKRPWIIVVLGIVAAVSLFIYFTTQPPGDTEIKGTEEAMAWVSLGTATVSLLTSLVGLILKVLDLKGAAASKDAK